MHVNTKSFLRLPEVLKRIPISRSSWWAGVKEGRYPQPIKIGPRTTVWRSEDIDLFIEKYSTERGSYEYKQ